jgi:hypothetical protein
MNQETRKALGLPPMPINNNKRRGDTAPDAYMEPTITVPACGVLAVYAAGFVCGMAVVMLYHLIF